MNEDDFMKALTADPAETEAEKAEAEESRKLRDMMEAAIFGTGHIRLETEVFTFGQEKGTPAWLNIRWPDGEDESMITIRTNAHLRGLSPDQVSASDANYARGKAMVEQLAVGPYPTWLRHALTDKKIRHRYGDREVEELRPDASKFKNRPVVQALYLRYVELYNRFHSIGLE